MIIGREHELDIFKKVLSSKEAELVAVYGRRRVGKTFLIREFFKSQHDIYMEFTGQKDADLHTQLKNFHEILLEHWDVPIKIPDSWSEAFSLLKRLIATLYSIEKKTITIFFDEVPWLAGKRHQFLESFEYFWNTFASKDRRIKIILCGSAASWMINQIVNQKGGLHNRVKHRIRLLPFTLRETNQYLHHRGIKYSPHDVMILYMVLGGVPFYLTHLEKGKSLAQNLDVMLFQKDGALVGEFNRLYKSLFENAATHIQVVSALGKKSQGLTRNEVIEQAKLSSGGSANRVLQNLEESGFITKTVPFDKISKNSIFRLVDEYSLFYLKWKENMGRQPYHAKSASGSWLHLSNSPAFRSWSGFAFESLCLKHIDDIKLQLGISGVVTQQSVWRSYSSANETKGAQIDLVIDRADQVICLCEMKFSRDAFEVTKKYATELRDKISTFRSKTKTNKTIFLTFVTASGLTRNQYSEELIQNQIDARKFF